MPLAIAIDLQSQFCRRFQRNIQIEEQRIVLFRGEIVFQGIDSLIISYGVALWQSCNLLRLPAPGARGRFDS